MKYYSCCFSGRISQKKPWMFQREKQGFLCRRWAFCGISIFHLNTVWWAPKNPWKNFWWLQNRYSLPKKHSFDVWKENRKSYWVLDQISQRLDHLILTVCQKWESLQASRPPSLGIVQWVVNIRLTPFRKTGALCQILFDRDIIMCCDSPPKVIKFTSRPAILRLL